MSMRMTTQITRRRLLAGCLALPWAALAQTASPRLKVTVWKSPQCGCCTDWVEHMEASGFAVEVREVADLDAQRQRLGMPGRYASCHTAQVGGYLLEGHVPAADVRRLLREQPPALGLAAPGMPIGSPGMDGPAYGGRKDAYAVLLIGKNGDAQVFARH